jgi:pimeloyl-ACP methyl ester carboxylesterase
LLRRFLVALLALACASCSREPDAAPAQGDSRKSAGTFYWGGSGLDGAYVEAQLQALRKAGILRVYACLDDTANHFLGERAGPLWDAARLGLAIRHENRGTWFVREGLDDHAPQFNLIGYSYGSLLAAQTANFYARQGHRVDHLVLIASPIAKDFLETLKTNRNIKKLIIIDLTRYGDPIHAGISQTDLIKTLPTLRR